MKLAKFPAVEQATDVPALDVLATVVRVTAAQVMAAPATSAIATPAQAMHAEAICARPTHVAVLFVGRVDARRRPVLVVVLRGTASRSNESSNAVFLCLA